MAVSDKEKGGCGGRILYKTQILLVLKVCLLLQKPVLMNLFVDFIVSDCLVNHDF